MSFVRLLLITILLVQSAHAAPPTEQDVRARIRKYASEESEIFQQKKQEVEQHMDRVLNGEMPRWRLGNQNPEQAFETEQDWIENVQTLMCNMSDGGKTYWHSYEDLQSEPEIEETENDGDCDCRIYYKYSPPGSGRASGLCRLELSLPPYCPTLCIDADLVEYYIAVRKHNVSDQRLMSRYLGTDENISVAKDLLFFIKTQAGDKAAKAIDEVLSSQALSGLINQPVNVDPQQIMPTLSPVLAFLQAGAYTHGFGRIWSEKNIKDDHQWFHPHVEKDDTFWATDYDFDMSMYIQDSEAVDSNKYDTHMRAPETCVRDNMATGKTGDFPSKINPNWTAKESQRNPQDLQDWHCLKEVGELFPYTAHNRRLYNTDGVFQTFVKTFQIYNHQYDKSERYSFRPDIDRLSLPYSFDTPALLNDKLNQDLRDKTSPFRCNLLDDISNNALSYEKSNVVDLGAGAETTIEEFVKFRGCWGWGGYSTYLLPIYEVYGPSSFEMYEKRVE